MEEQEMNVILYLFFVQKEFVSTVLATSTTEFRPNLLW